MRIISLLPSATEIVCELGLREQLVGVSHECDFPASVKKLPVATQSRISSDAPSDEIDRLVREQLHAGAPLYSLREDVLASLKPDLIVTQALCDVCAVAEADVHRVAARLPGPPRVINLEPMRLSEVLDSMEQFGRAAGIERTAIQLTRRLRQRVDEVRRRSEKLTHAKSTVFLEWIDPLFCAGHWTPELIRIAGGTECLGQECNKSRTIQWHRVVDANPDAIVIACCGFNVSRTLDELPRLQQQPGFDELRCVREGEVYVIDGNAYFNRPGPRLVDSLEILANALHPSVHRLPPQLDAAIRIDRVVRPTRKA